MGAGEGPQGFQVGTSAYSACMKALCWMGSAATVVAGPLHVVTVGTWLSASATDKGGGAVPRCRGMAPALPLRSNITARGVYVGWPCTDTQEPPASALLSVQVLELVESTC